uniref:Rab-GAP TBC domain-containing protein n=1 Tax=Strongyloides papillosus TaxID=174720 RepID=A0A0N5C091_STREA
MFNNSNAIDQLFFKKLCFKLEESGEFIKRFEEEKRRNFKLAMAEKILLEKRGDERILKFNEKGYNTIFYRTLYNIYSLVLCDNDRKKKYCMDGFINIAERVLGLEFLKEISEIKNGIDFSIKIFYESSKRDFFITHFDALFEEKLSCCQKKNVFVFNVESLETSLRMINNFYRTLNSNKEKEFPLIDVNEISLNYVFQKYLIDIPIIPYYDITQTFNGIAYEGNIERTYCLFIGTVVIFKHKNLITILRYFMMLQVIMPHLPLFGSSKYLYQALMYLCGAPEKFCGKKRTNLSTNVSLLCSKIKESS